MSPLIELKCVNCGSQLVSEILPGQYPAARCPHCKSLFAMPAPAAAPIPRPQVALPKPIRMEDGGGALTITRRWIGVTAFLMVPFIILWNGFMIGWHAVSLSTGMWIMSLFGLIHTAVGAWLTYFTVAQFTNSTVISSMPGWLTVKHGPLPWRGNLRIASDEIRQFFCVERVKHGKNGPTVTYRVEMIMADGSRRMLVKDLPKPELAIYIEQQLERHLNLLDTPVTGGYRG